MQKCRLGRTPPIVCISCARPDPALPCWHDLQHAAAASGGWPDNGKAGRRSGAHRANQGQGHRAKGIKSPRPPPAPTRPRSGAKGPGAPLKQRAETCRSSRAQRDKRADGGARELKPLPTCSASPGSGASIVSRAHHPGGPGFLPQSIGGRARLPTKFPDGRNAKAKFVPAKVSKDYLAKAHVGHLAACPRLPRVCRIGYRPAAAHAAAWASSPIVLAVRRL